MTPIIPPSLDWSRPWAARETNDFDAEQLVKVQTMDDDKVCIICEEAKANSPYTMTEEPDGFCNACEVLASNLNRSDIEVLDTTRHTLGASE